MTLSLFIATAFSALCYDFYSLIVYASIYGFTIGAYVGLTSVILVDLLGLDRLTNAFGLLLLFQGIASFLGPPIAGRAYCNNVPDSNFIIIKIGII
jgi:MFS family permease